MLSKTPFRIAGAAMLGTVALLGTNAAYAAIKINDGDDPATYAKETVVDTGAIDQDGTKYYNLMKEHTLRASLGVGARAADDWSVAFTFTGMVLSEPFVGTALEVCEAPDTTQDPPEDINDSACSPFSTAPTVISGGGKGHDNATFLITNQAVSAQQGVELTAKFAISGDSADAAMVVTNITLASLQLGTFTADESRSGVIKLASAIDETTTATDVTTTVASSFKQFMGDTTDDDDMSVANVGSFMVSFKTEHLNASNATDADNVNGLDDLVDTSSTTGASPRPNSTVTFMGDFSFASNVHVDAADTCATAADVEDDLLMRDEDDMVSDTTMTMPVNVMEFASAKFLCITVDTSDEDADVRIMATDPYMAVASYKQVTDRAFEPMGADNKLGRIERDGTTVHIPYMTTAEMYNHRIVLSNRGSIDADFSIEFRPESGVMASDTYEGTLEKNSTVTMKAIDVVTLTGGSRTAATITLEATPMNIDVTSVIVNKDSGDTDTVVHHSGM